MNLRNMKWTTFRQQIKALKTGMEIRPSQPYTDPHAKQLKKEQYNASINSQGHRFLVEGDFNEKHQYWSSA
jgi:hypothetical protein